MDAKVYFRGVNSLNFYNYFKTEEDCYKYLAQLKWDSGYKCKRCGYDKYCTGKKPHSKRCIKCTHDESPTARTVFDKIKFPILIAFHVAFKISARKKGMSTLELSREFGLRQKTCWEFKRKIQRVMESSKRYKLNGSVQVDEFFIGGPEDDQRVRSKGKKRIVIVALEIVKNGVGRAYAKVINDFSSEEFFPFFNDYISKDAKIQTDEWNGYIPIKESFPKLKQKPSDGGKNFPELHIHIMNLKGWLRGIHHHCSEEHLQGYLNEYHFRYNRRNSMDGLFEILLKRMVAEKPIR